MKIEINDIVTFKINSGEEVVDTVKNIEADHYMIKSPVSIAPGNGGVQLIPSAFTMDLDKLVRLNISAVTMIFETNEAIKTHYIEATTGIKTLDKKKIILG
jgi:hypothetical protein